jgi:hypothetical protein
MVATIAGLRNESSDATEGEELRYKLNTSGSQSLADEESSLLSHLRNVAFVIFARLQPEDGGSKLLRNACNYLLTNTGLYFGRLRSQVSLPVK